MQNKSNKIILLGNIQQEKHFKNPQIGRIYSVLGISPALNTCGGGGREPKILIKVNKDDTRKIFPTGD